MSPEGRCPAPGRAGCRERRPRAASRVVPGLGLVSWIVSFCDRSGSGSSLAGLDSTLLLGADLEREVIETGEKVPTIRPDAAMAIGTLENGALFSVQIEGAQHQRTGLQIDITGTEGVL